MTNETKKILVADDDVFMMELLHYLLTKRGYEVISAANKEMALFQLKEAKPDLFIFDHQMFQADGLDIIKKVKESHEEVGVIVLTGSANKKIEQQAREFGVDAFLQKRMPTNLFIESVQNVLSR